MLVKDIYVRTRACGDPAGARQGGLVDKRDAGIVHSVRQLRLHSWLLQDLLDHRIGLVWELAFIIQV